MFEKTELFLAKLKTLLQITKDHKMHERFYTNRDFRWAADLRYQANRLQTVAESLAGVSQKDLDCPQHTLSTVEKNGGISIEQLELLNDRSSIPYMAILFYGHGREPAEIKEIKNSLYGMQEILKETSEMLFKYMANHFEDDPEQLIRANKNFLDACLWRTRLTTGLYCVATYYKMAGEVINLALLTLDKASLTGVELIKEEKRKETVELLMMVTTLLNDAALFMGLAGTELGRDEERWRRLEGALVNILGEGNG